MEINSNTEARAERAQRILQALRAKDETTLTELTRVTKISRPTVGNIIADLEYYGIIAQRSTSTGAGRPAALYGFAPQHGFVVALDIQRDILSTTIASLAGDILHTTIMPLETLAREERLEAISQHVRQAVEVLRIQHGNPICGFASATGIIDGDGTVLRSYLVPQWHGINLAEELTRRCGFPFRVDNDINTAAPSADNILTRLRTHVTPSGSRPLTGSSRTTFPGLVRSAAAMPRRCFIPRENLPARRLETACRPVSSRTSSTRESGTSCISASAVR